MGKKELAECDNCGAEMFRKNNRHRYCEECAPVMRRKSKTEAMARHRAKKRAEREAQAKTPPPPQKASSHRGGGGVKRERGDPFAGCDFS